mmetsp:Transcript_31452/g.60638  ORF Transcript_31452/g.60638 Transcript_31452/m.60638 type:complete len:203 (+) Transcript_31452:1139-1747(+)
MMCPDKSSTSPLSGCKADKSWGFWNFALSACPADASQGVTAMDRATTKVSSPDNVVLIMPSLTASPKVTNANSPPGARKRPARNAFIIDTPTRGPSIVTTASFPTRSAPNIAITLPNPLTSNLGSTVMPTVIKNKPSSKPRYGAMSDSTCRWNSVSASSSPARKAPSAELKPRLSVSRLVPNTTNRVVAAKISALLVLAMHR